MGAAVQLRDLVKARLRLGLRSFGRRCGSVRVVGATVREGTASGAHKQAKRKQ